MLNWANRFNICLFLDNHHYSLPHHSIECLLAAGAGEMLTASAGSAFSALSAFYKKQNDWLFGHFSYDLKNETEPSLQSQNFDGIRFPDLHFFVPSVIVELSPGNIKISSMANDHDRVFEEIQAAKIPTLQPVDAPRINNRFTREAYINTVENLKRHILYGDCYEINLCQEFYAKDFEIDPLQLFIRLNETSPNPFSGYYRLNDKHLCCLSPERYLRKEGQKILSQPIKGTAARSSDTAIDEQNRRLLENSTKERAENIMVVDLVRNDLSRIAAKGSVVVEELCKVYSFPNVHQMISTVSGRVDENLEWTEAIRATFPMGSMTGAPKKRVMELIEEYELSKRGLFSGSIGYIDPEGNFDFNVVIRSVLYNEADKYLSFHAGSAITFSSDAAQEYEECLLKASAIKKALTGASTFR